MNAYKIYKTLLPELKRGTVQFQFIDKTGYSYPSFARLVKEEKLEPIYYRIFDKIVMAEAADLLKDLKTVIKDRNYVKRDI